MLILLSQPPRKPRYISVAPQYLILLESTISQSKQHLNLEPVVLLEMKYAGERETL